MIQANVASLGRLLAGQGQEVAHDADASVGAGQDLLGSRDGSRILRRFPEQVALPEHDRQGIVQLVGHPGEQRAHRRDLLALEKSLGALVHDGLERAVLAVEREVELAVLDQQHHQHEARGQEPVDPTGVEAEVEPAGVEDRGERDVEEPGAHHDHEPEVEHRVRPAPPERDQGDQAEPPDARDDADHGGGVVVAPHDPGKPVLAGRREKRASGYRHERCPDAAEDGAAGTAARLARF